jgi:cell pole-organizing protein PopZ
MTRLKTIPVIALAIAGVAASSAAAQPEHDAGHASTAVAKAEKERLAHHDIGYATAVSSASELPRQDLRSPDTRDAALRPNLAPVFPAYPELAQRPAPSATVSTPDDDLPVWPIAGAAAVLIGLAGASVVGRRQHSRLGT